MILLKMLKNLLTVLHSETSPREIAGGVALGAIIGLNPSFTLHNIIIFLVILIVKVNIGAAFLSMALFGVIGFALDPVAHLIGSWLLIDATSLTPLWTRLYNMPLVPFTKFNNTVVLGSFIIALLLFVPVLVTSEKLVVYYRKNYHTLSERWKVLKVLKLANFLSIFRRQG